MGDLLRALRARLRGDDAARVRFEAGGTFLVGVMLTLLGLTDLWPNPWSGLAGAPASSGWHVLPLAVGTLAMLAKRRAPVAALLVGLASLALDVWLGGSVAMIIVVYDLLFAAVLYGAPAVRRCLVGGLAAAIAVCFVASQGSGHDLRTTALLVIQVFALLGTPIWWATNVRQKTELAELREDEVVREERTRMARDLHDVIAGHLTSIAINAEAALGGSPDERADREALRRVRESGIDALEEMRSMILLLRSGAEPVASAAGLARLDELVRTTRASDLDVDLAIDVDLAGAAPHPLPAAVDQAAFRIVQESLTNAAKHAPAGSARVHLSASPDALDVVVENTLPGNRRGAVPLSAPVRGGSGLTIMRERAEALGGTFEAGPYESGVADRCWRVRAVLPLGGGS